MPLDSATGLRGDATDSLSYLQSSVALPNGTVGPVHGTTILHEAEAVAALPLHNAESGAPGLNHRHHIGEQLDREWRRDAVDFYGRRRLTPAPALAP